MTLQVGWRSELDDGDGAIVRAVVENSRSREGARIFDVVEQQASSNQFQPGLAPPRNLALRLVRSRGEKKILDMAGKGSDIASR